jgi:pyruvate dehydrogenase E2 component (dihydrolipoamide acetyltransferase)
MAQETGRLLNWYKNEGQQVTKGEPLMEVETDKITVSLEAPESGVLANVIATVGQDVPVGQVIAHILAPGEKAPPRPVARVTAPIAATPTSAVSQPQRAAQPVRSVAAPAPMPRTGQTVVVNASPIAARMAAENGVDLALIKPYGGRVSKDDVLAYLQSKPAAAPIASVRKLASPKAKRLAKELGVDLQTLFGSGPQGSVLAIDVLPVAKAGPSPVAEEPAGLKLSNLWRVMAEHVTQSWTDVPQFFLMREVDATNLISAREKALDGSKTKITYTDLLVKLVAKALGEHPNVNATWRSNTIVLQSEINVGLAVGIEDGLVVPVVHNSDKLSLQDVAAKRIELVEKATSKSLKPQDIQGGTFTISNLGMYNIDGFSAIVNAPQAAILAVGRIAERVVPVDGKPVVRPMLALTLSCDHRVIDGLRGAQFLDALAKLIEAPYSG